MSRSLLASALSLNGGYVDTMGFVALHGLFTAHVTGNFVTLGAAIATGTGGLLAKALALPVFCVSVMAARYFARWLGRHERPVVPVLLKLQFALFSAAAVLVFLLPTAANSAGEIITGMTLVVAMAIQNAVHRVHLPDLPPSTLMTGTTTQIMLDVTDLVFGGAIDKEPLKRRLRRLIPALFLFALGCALAALAYRLVGRLCFLVPPIIILLAFYAFRLEDRAENPAT
ncbi:MAG: YoaK family protein [Martelella sp.]|uniref:YoaK family protein n=1 Tax=Martelella sp. TaxID=1969699 RepID=UPI003242C914